MKIERLDDNTVRITLNLDDLKEKNIDFNSFMSNPIETQSFFLDVLETAEKEIGFVTKNRQLSIDALATSTGNFIVTVTRSGETSQKVKVRARRKELKITKSIIIYSFTSFEDVVLFCKFAEKHFAKNSIYMDKNTSLYTYQNAYYICFKNVDGDSSDLKRFCSSMAEFGQYITSSDLFERKLIEYGTLIIKKNVINSINKQFIN